MWCFFIQFFDVFLALVFLVSADRMWPALCWLSYLVFLATFATFRAEYLILYVKFCGCLYSCSWLRAFLIDYFSVFTQLALTHIYSSLFFGSFWAVASMVKFDISLWNILTSARKSSKCFKFYWENQRCVDSRCSLEPFLMRLIGFCSSSGYSFSCYLGNLSSCCSDLFSTLLGKYLVVLKIDVFVFFFAFTGGQICCLSTWLPLQVKQSQN